MHNDTERTTAVGFARYATEFFECALAADDKVGKRPGAEIIAPIPVMYLVGHSIELGLKAYLILHDVPLKELYSKQYGHDLKKSLKKAKELKLNTHVKLNFGELRAFMALNELYSTKQKNNKKTGTKQKPKKEPNETLC